MYYLDFTQLYKITNKEQRNQVRKTINRDKEMAYKLRLQRNMCFFCGCSITMAGHLDHLIPVYRGGSNISRNLVASCRSCNLTKGADIIEITNPWTIKDYQSRIAAKKKYDDKLKKKNVSSFKHVPKKVQLYSVYRADLFKRV